MRKILLFVTVIVLLTACTGKSFIQADPADFNALIAERTDITDPKNLALIYYNYSDAEGVPQITVESKKIKNNKFEVVLIHDRLADDSVRAMKIVMIASRSGERWTVLEIRKQWKCYEGRGHTDWGTGLCN